MSTPTTTATGATVATPPGATPTGAPGADIALGLAVLLIAGGEIWSGQIGLDGAQQISLAIVAAGLALAVGLARLQPGGALAVIWATGFFQIVTSSEVLITQVTVAIVAFGTARYGSVATLWLSGLSIPLGALLGLVYVLRGYGGRLLDLLGYSGAFDGRLVALGAAGVVIPALLGAALLAAPWLAGLALRSIAAARASRRGQVAAEEEAAQARVATQQAEEIALLRSEQARLARDVHDVVGHSLAVILAQAESGRILPDTEPARIRATLDNIVTTARTSLHDVREVLASTGDSPHGATSRIGELDTLIDGVRAAGNEVSSTVHGRARPLPPELAVVAFRVLQEMLTNALRHGRRGAPVEVTQEWGEELRLRVRNPLDAEVGGDDETTEETTTLGLGVEGMRRRLEAVGGRLDVRREPDAEPPTWTATAWLPLRAEHR